MNLLRYCTIFWNMNLEIQVHIGGLWDYPRFWSCMGNRMGKSKSEGEIERSEPGRERCGSHGYLHPHVFDNNGNGSHNAEKYP